MGTRMTKRPNTKADENTGSCGAYSCSSRPEALRRRRKPGSGHSSSHCLLLVYRCTRAHSPHPRPSSLAWPLRFVRLFLFAGFFSLFAHGAPVYPYTLAASSTLAWPLVP